MSRNAIALACRIVASAAVGGTVLTLFSEVVLAQSKPATNATDSAVHQVVNGPEKDPNMPDIPYQLPGVPIFWIARGDTKQVTFLKPPSASATAVGSYLGFNARGSWIRNEGDRSVYVWNMKEGRLTLGAESDAGVPLDLRNPSPIMKGMIARATGRGGSGTVAASNSNGRNTPYIPPSVANEGNAQHSGAAGANGLSGAGTSTPIKGSGAIVRDGVLAFTNEAGESVSLKVTRPPNQGLANPNAPRPNGNAGAWLAEDPRDASAVISLYVTEHGAVSGSKLTGLAAQAMKRIMNTPAQRQ